MAQLRKIFRAYENNIWQQLTDELGGQFTDEAGWRQDNVTVHIDEWTVTLDYHCEPGYRTEHIYTRLRAPYVNADGLRFNVYHAGVFNGIAKLFGVQDVKVGHKEFDEMFVVKTNNEQKMKALCANARLRELIKTEPHIHLQVRDSGSWFAEAFPDGVDELVLEVEDNVRKLERLRRLYALFAEMLHTLCHIGSAYEDAPDLST